FGWIASSLEWDALSTVTRDLGSHLGDLATPGTHEPGQKARTTLKLGRGNRRGVPAKRREKRKLFVLMMAVRIGRLLVLDERDQRDSRSVPRCESMDRDDPPHVFAAGRAGHAHDDEQVGSRESRCRYPDPTREPR